MTALVPLYEETLASSGTFDVSSISQAYDTLVVELTLRGTKSAAEVGARIRFNNDSGSNYEWQQWAADGSSVSAVRATSQTYMEFVYAPAATSSDADAVTYVKFEIPNYTNTQWWKLHHSEADTYHNNELTYYGASGVWRDSSAVSRIQVFPESGSWVADSRIEIYGKSAAPLGDQKISELDAITTLAGTEEFVVADSGDNKKITAANLAAAFGSADPVFDTFGTPDTAFEFDTSSFTGLSSLASSPTAEDADTTIPGRYYLQASGAGVYGRVASVSSPCTVIAKVWCPARGNNYVHGAVICEASPGKIEMSAAGVTPSGGNGEEIMLQINYSNPTTFSAASGVIYHNLPRGWWYSAIRVHSNTNVDYLFSFDGISWQATTLARDPGMTIGGAGVALNASSATHYLHCDFIRIWNSALTMPGV